MQWNFNSSLNLPGSLTEIKTKFDIPVSFSELPNTHDRWQLLRKLTTLTNISEKILPSHFAILSIVSGLNQDQSWSKKQKPFQTKTFFSKILLKKIHKLFVTRLCVWKSTIYEPSKNKNILISRTRGWWLSSVRFKYKPGYRPCDLL